MNIGEVEKLSDLCIILREDVWRFLLFDQRTLYRAFLDRTTFVVCAPTKDNFEGKLLNIL